MIVARRVAASNHKGSLPSISREAPGWLGVSLGALRAPGTLCDSHRAQIRSRIRSTSLTACERFASTFLVPAQPASSPDSAVRFAVDVRRLPWMRRLAVDYAFDFARVAPFFAGNPADRRVVAGRHRGRTAPPARPRRDITESSLRSSKGEARRARLRPHAPARRHRHGRNRHRAAGRAVRRPGFTLLKAAHRHRLAERVHASTASHACRLLDRRRGPRLGRSPRLRRARCPARARGHRRRRAGGRRRAHDRIAALARRHHRRRRCALRALPATEFTPWLQEVVRAAYAPGAWRRRSFGRLLDALLGPHGLVVYDASDLAAKPLVGRALRPGARAPGPDGAPGRPRRRRPRGSRLSHAGHAARGQRRSVRAGRRPRAHQSRRLAIHHRGVTVPNAEMVARARAHPERSARTCCCGRSCRTRCCRQSPTWRGRTSWPTSRSCGVCTRRSACRCRSCSRARRRRSSTRPACASYPDTECRSKSFRRVTSTR